MIQSLHRGLTSIYHVIDRALLYEPFVFCSYICDLAYPTNHVGLDIFSFGTRSNKRPTRSQEGYGKGESESGLVPKNRPLSYALNGSNGPEIELVPEETPVFFSVLNDELTCDE